MTDLDIVADELKRLRRIEEAARNVHAWLEKKNIYHKYQVRLKAALYCDCLNYVPGLSGLSPLACKYCGRMMRE